jgi:hypothetical protein
MPWDIDRSLKKFISLSSSKSFQNMGRGSNYFSSGGLKQPFPNTFQQQPQQKFPETYYTNAKKVVLDGKPVYYVGSKQNAPSPRIVQRVYATIPDDKNVPVVFETKKQYLQEYIKNQELANNVKFSKREKQQYVKHELKEMRPVVSRFTTYHNDFMPPRTVFFTDNKFNKDNGNFEVSALHEYWHEKTEGNKKLQDDEVAAEQYARDRATNDWQSKNMVFKMHYGVDSVADKNVKTVLMNPEDFLRTAYKESQLSPGAPYQPYEAYKAEVLRRSSVDWHKKAIPSKRMQVEIPFLMFDKWGRPIGHEGRHTSQAAVELGLNEIPVTIEQRRYSREWEKPPYSFQGPFSSDVKKLLNSPTYKEQAVPNQYVYTGEYKIDEDKLEREKNEYWEKEERERAERRQISEQRLKESQAALKALEDSYTDEEKVEMMLLENDISKDKSLSIKEDWSNQQLRKNRGYVDLVQINAQKFKEEFEKEQQTKLAWNKNRSESIANVEVFDSHPQIDFNYMLDVNDGRHRINRAAEQGDDIVVAVKGPHIVEKLKQRGILSEDQSDVNYIDFNDESNDREEYNDEELQKRSDEFRRKKQLENKEYTRQLQQLPLTATTDDKAYEILRLAAEKNRFDVVERERIIRNMESAIKSNPLTGTIFQVAESGIQSKPINIFEGNEREVAKQLGFTMENFMIEEEAKQQLSRLLFNEEYYHNLKPHQKRKILYLIRKQTAST